MKKVGFYILKKLWNLPLIKKTIKIFRLKNFEASVYSLFKPQGITTINFEGYKLYLDSADKDLGLKLLLNGFSEEKYGKQLFKEKIKEGMMVLDIGANLGVYTLLAAKLVGKNGIIYSFEPFLKNFQLLSQTVKANNLDNVRLIKKAVAEAEGKKNFGLKKTFVAVLLFHGIMFWLFQVTKP